MTAKEEQPSEDALTMDEHELFCELIRVLNDVWALVARWEADPVEKLAAVRAVVSGVMPEVMTRSNRWRREERGDVIQPAVDETGRDDRAN